MLLVIYNIHTVMMGIERGKGGEQVRYWPQESSNLVIQTAVHATTLINESATE